MAGKPSEADQSLTLILLAGVIGAIGYGIWYFFHAQIIGLLAGIRTLELRGISLFTHNAVMPDGAHVTTQQLLDWLSSINPMTLSWGQMAVISQTVVPQFLRWPTVIVLLVLAGIAYRYAPRNKLRHIFTLEDLIKVQAMAWPISSPVTKINPATGPQRAPGDLLPAVLPPFAEALSPEEFVAFNHIPITNRVIDRDAAARVFTRQLGPRWQGWDKMPWHYRALAAAFAVKGARSRDAADTLLGEIAQCWNPATGLVLTADLKGRIRQILRDPKRGGEAEKVMAMHAFVVPGMFRLLLWSRERGGVLASATFIWLRAVDRNLWYPLNNAGRRTFHPEAAGAAAHYYAEKFLRRPLIIPKVQGAVDALAEHIKEFDLPIPDAVGPPPMRPRAAAPRPGGPRSSFAMAGGGRA